MSLSNQRVFVTGATGFLGGALTKRLSDEGARVLALARRANRDPYIKDLPDVEIVTGDITDAQRMQDLIHDIDYVFHVGAALSGKLEHQRKVNVDGTRIIAEAGAKAGIKRLIYVSSIASYGFPVPKTVSEDTPAKLSRTPYNLTKRESEDMLRELAPRLGLSYSIIRPALIYGPRSHMWTGVMFNLAKRKPTPFIGDGSGHAHPIFVDDVVDLLLRMATHPQADGQAFNCAPDPAPTWREFLGAYSRLAGHERWLSIPIPLVKLIAPLVDLITQLQGEPQEAPEMIDFMTSKTTYKMDKARDLLGWQAQVSLEDGIKACIPYLREKGELK